MLGEADAEGVPQLQQPQAADRQEQRHVREPEMGQQPSPRGAQQAPGALAKADAKAAGQNAGSESRGA